jgi:hypothetical protein
MYPETFLQQASSLLTLFLAARVQATAEQVATPTLAHVPLRKVTSTILPTVSAAPKSRRRAATMDPRRAALSTDTGKLSVLFVR